MEPHHVACARETLRRSGKAALPGKAQTFLYKAIDGVTALDRPWITRKHSSQFSPSDVSSPLTGAEVHAFPFRLSQAKLGE